MSQPCTGRASFPGTGSQTVILGCNYQPTWCEIVASGKGAGAGIFSRGFYDGTRQNCVWMFQDTTGGTADSDSTNVIRTKKRSGGSIIDNEVASVTGFGFNGTNGTITFNVTSVDTGLSFSITAGD